MAVPIGTNVINSVSKQFVMPQVTDVVYNSNVFTFRILARNKKRFEGGTQVEVPIAWSHFAAGGWYTGFDLLDTTPSDTIKNAAFDLTFSEVPVSIDGPSLIRVGSPQAAWNFMGQYFAQAESELSDILGTGVFNSGSDPKALVGVNGAIDNGATLATYGGLSRSANTFWNSQVAAAVAPLTFPQLQQVFGNATQGGRRPTLLVGTQAIYNIIWALSTGVNSTAGVPGQAFPAMAGGEDVQLAQAGFSNILFNGVPVAVDSHCPAGNLFMVNEEYWYLYVHPNRDFYLRDFQVSLNQDAYVSFVFWAGALICSNPLRQGKLTGVVA